MTKPYIKRVALIYFLGHHKLGIVCAHSGGTETKVKEIVSDIPPHTNQNIGIF